MYCRYLCVLTAICALATTHAEIHRARAGYKTTAKRSSHEQSSEADVAVGSEMPTNIEETMDIGVESHSASVHLLEAEEFRTGYGVWIYSIAGSILVGFSGILPLLIMPIEAGPSLKHGAPAARLKLMLSFAVGSLLGDVFCHLLPEVWNYMDRDDHGAHRRIGLWVIAGLLFFMIVEKLLGDETEFEVLDDTCDEIEDDTSGQEIQEATKKQSQIKQRNSQTDLSPNSRQKKQPNRKDLPTINGKVTYNISHLKGVLEKDKPHIKVSGYLNLFANVVDNFTHGLAVAGSFLVSKRVGILTTGAILVHEIPHEFGDFAILLRSGFDRWKAAKAQFLTASGGVFGAITALTAEQAGERTAWILAFTSGGFLYIALVTVVPDLLQERHGRESMKQVAFLVLGILCMVFVTYISG